MNLYIFRESGRSAIFGVGTYIREMVAALIASDINITIVHLHSKKTTTDFVELEGIQHLFLPAPIDQNRTVDRKKYNELYYKSVVYILRLKIIDKERLVFHFNFNKCAKLAEGLKNAFDCRIVTTVHVSDWSLVIYDNPPRLSSILNSDNPDDLDLSLRKSIKEEKNLYSITDQVICLSNYMYEILIRNYNIDPSKITFIPNGISVPPSPLSPFLSLKEKWKLPVKEKIILFVGRIDHAKGLLYLIKAFRNVLHVCPQSRLVIAGDGDISDFLKESRDICMKVTYTGLLDKTQLYELYSIADVGVIPSLYETFCYVAVEMMMHGLPIVATATSGLNEVVDDTCGLKLPIMIMPDKVEIDTLLLSEKIIYLLQNPREAKRIRENAHKRYERHYSLEVFRKNMLNFYNSLWD